MNREQNRTGRVDNVYRAMPLLTVRQTCKMLNVHANTLRRWSAHGLIGEYRIGPGGQRRFDAEEVAALVGRQISFKQPVHRK
jgi:excisionase family DNA binding protein